jgi:phospholipase D
MAKYKLIIVLIIHLITKTALAHEEVKKNITTINLKNTDTQVCFTPPSGCTELIVKQIENAKKSIFIQAYGFSSTAIVDSIINAHLRGIKVKVILDRSNLTQRYSKLKEIRKSGIEVTIDSVPGIAHNKVMIIDEHIVITGSFNFTDSADKRNSENVIIIDDKELSAQFLKNWHSRKKK